MSEAPASTPSRSAGLPRLIGVAVAVFLLTFSLVPLYRIACEKVFGVRRNAARVVKPIRVLQLASAPCGWSSMAASIRACRGRSIPSS